MHTWHRPVLKDLRVLLARRCPSGADNCPRTAVLLQEKTSSRVTIARRAFVGGDAEPAGEYHDCDFLFEDHKKEVEDAHQHFVEDSQEATVPPCGLTPTAELSNCWDNFHRLDNSTAKFYKERRYLLLEFPVLTVPQPPQHFVEIGCGAGSSLLPVLKANPSCRVTATDLSPTAVTMFQEAAKSAGIGRERVFGFPFDSTDLCSIPNPLQGLEADAVLLVFTLAALSPAQMPAMLQNAFKALKPGGLLLLRDHGLYDITHLRLQREQRVGHRLYRRQDGTLCYFFTVQDLEGKMRAAGFELVECKYACVSLGNRKRKLDMKRVFVLRNVPETAAAVAGN